MIRLLLVGNPGGTNVADSFLHAAREKGIEAALAPSTTAFRSNRIHRTISWRVLGHRPPLLAPFSQRVGNDAHTIKATHVVATGLAPVTADVLRTIEARKIVFLTDDPWHPDFRSSWFMDAVLQYDVVYTPRRSNIDDLINHGCRDVRYLPFGYDPRHFFREERPAEFDVFFAGGAEDDRVRYLKPLMSDDLRVALAGDRWDRYAETRAYYKGHFDPAELRRATAAARVSICLVRKSNRDGHVMRTFEIPACGGCLLAEDTAEHRAIYGPHGDAVLYFNSPDELHLRVHELLTDVNLRQKLRDAAHRIVTEGRNTYGHRLATILQSP
ncbi:MAG TPA: glycosyltransferase [Longimicrobiales bacterium]|nr:glycosyltransferase [Longimicrobiales bacterium]